MSLSFIQVVGAAWYLLSVDRYTSCWKKVCKKEFNTTRCNLDCDAFNHEVHKMWANRTNVFDSCDPKKNITFNYGIFQNAVEKNVVSSAFVEKYFYCLWWGLQQLRYDFIVSKHQRQQLFSLYSLSCTLLTLWGSSLAGIMKLIYVNGLKYVLPSSSFIEMYFIYCTSDTTTMNRKHQL